MISVQNILLISTIYPLPEGNHGTAVCHFFAREWVKMGYGVLSRFNPENMESGSGRTDIWSMILGKLADSNYLIPIGLNEAMKGQTNAFVHNTFLEIWFIIFTLFCMNRFYSKYGKNIFCNSNI